MKKKHFLLGTISILALSLTSCEYISRFFNSDSDSPWIIPIGGSSSSNEPTSTSKAPSTDISTPPADDITPKRASCDYSDLVSNSVYPISSTPSEGNAKILVIPVWFTDSTNFITSDKRENVRSDIEKIYFGNASDTGWHSVKSYYEEESLGALTLTGTVSEWYECGKSYTKYGKETPNEESSVPNTSALVESATNWYFTNHTSESRKDYDCDHDGYLDGVMLIYAAPDYDTLNRSSYDNLWAYCFWIQDYDAQNVNKPGVNAFFWASYDFMYGQEVASSRTGKTYKAGDTSHCSLDGHTYIHEMGHMFGLEDYYDYSSLSYQPAGSFSMQDHNVGGHDPFSSFALGWGKAYIPTSSVTIDLKPFATDGEMIILSPQWNTYNSPFDEYLIIEYFTDLGLNEFDTTYKYMKQYGKNYPTATHEYGIRLWHVDARLLYTNSGEFSAYKTTTNPKIMTGRVAMMMSNTYAGGDADDYCSVLGTSYANYNLLQMIRNNTSANYKPKDSLSSSSLFKAGDTFSMSKYSKQFVNSGKLNSQKDLGFSFEVNACNSTYASITITKA